MDIYLGLNGEAGRLDRNGIGAQVDERDHELTVGRGDSLVRLLWTLCDHLRPRNYSSGRIQNLSGDRSAIFLCFPYSGKQPYEKKEDATYVCGLFEFMHCQPPNEFLVA